MRARESGYTLIEIMVVVAMMAGVMALIAPRLTSRNDQIRTAMRKLGGLPHNLQTQARLRNMTYRLVIQMDEKEGYKYWVEGSPGQVRILTEEQQKELMNLTSFEREKRVGTSSFTVENEFIRGEQTLPPKIKFLEVEYRDREKSLTEGTAYIHFFPQGLAQEAAIHLGDGDKLHWTLAIRPLTGQADIITENVRLKELE